MFKLADLFVQITGDSKPLTSALVMVQQQLMGMSGLAGQFGGSLASGIAGQLLGLGTKAAVGVGLTTIAVGALSIALGKAAMMAGHLTEAVNKSEQVFGSSNGKIVALADELARKFGVVKTTVLDTSASFGLMLEGAGIDRAKAADMSATLMRLTADAKSFFDVPLEEAVTRISSGLSGEMEAVRRWGINMSEANVKQKAMAMGLSDGKKEMDQATKTAVRYQLIIEGLKPAEGDLERTGGGLTQQWEKFTGQLQNLATTVGTAVMPVFTALLRAINGMLGYVGPIVEDWASWTMEMYKFSGPITDLASAIGSGLIPMLEILRAEFQAVMWLVGGTVKNISALVGWIGRVTGLSDLLTVEDNSDQALTDRQAQIDARIKATQDQFKADQAAAGAAKKPDKPFRGSLVEYANKLAEAAAGAGKKSVDKLQLAASQKSNDLLTKIAMSVQKPNSATAAAALAT